MISLDRGRYAGLTSYAGGWLSEHVPRPFPVDQLDHLDVASGVYVVEDALDRVRYVGSVCRPGNSRGIACRLREHLRDPGKRLTWHHVWVVPLREDTPRRIVRAVEGAVGAELTPVGNLRLPSIV
jgi:hypothetical protein